MELKPIVQLRPSDWNPRLIRDKRFKQLVASIRRDPRYLERREVLATKDGVIYDGNMRFRAVEWLYQQGWESPWGSGLIPASLDDISEQTAKRRSLTGNTHQGEWSDTDLAEIIAELKFAGEELETLGFSDAELEKWLAESGLDAQMAGPASVDHVARAAEGEEAITPEEVARPDGMRGKTVSEFMESYQAATILQVELHYPLDEYRTVIDNLAWLRAHFGVESNAQAIAKLLGEYRARHP